VESKFNAFGADWPNVAGSSKRNSSKANWKQYRSRGGASTAGNLAAVHPSQCKAFEPMEAARFFRDHLRTLTMICGKDHKLNRDRLSMPLAHGQDLFVRRQLPSSVFVLTYQTYLVKSNDTQSVSQEIKALQRFCDREALTSLTEDLSSAPPEDIMVSWLIPKQFPHAD
jgi:hypothetical protein